jgi:hypothetical protein
MIFPKFRVDIAMTLPNSESGTRSLRCVNLVGLGPAIHDFFLAYSAQKKDVDGVPLAVDRESIFSASDHLRVLACICLHLRLTSFFPPISYPASSAVRRRLWRSRRRIAWLRQ